MNLGEKKNSLYLTGYILPLREARAGTQGGA